MVLTHKFFGIGYRALHCKTLEFHYLSIKFTNAYKY